MPATIMKSTFCKTKTKLDHRMGMNTTSLVSSFLKEIILLVLIGIGTGLRKLRVCAVKKQKFSLQTRFTSTR